MDTPPGGDRGDVPIELIEWGAILTDGGGVVKGDDPQGRVLLDVLLLDVLLLDVLLLEVLLLEVLLVPGA